jgi:hypothetical protein
VISKLKSVVMRTRRVPRERHLGVVVLEQIDLESGGVGEVLDGRPLEDPGRLARRGERLTAQRLHGVARRLDGRRDPDVRRLAAEVLARSDPESQYPRLDLALGNGHQFSLLTR